MKEENNQNVALERQIKDLQHEIAKLSALLAVKKMESNHPSLEKLANELSRLQSYIGGRAEKVKVFEHQHLGNLSTGNLLKVFGRILCIGTLGYAISLLFGWIEREGRK